MPAKLAPELPQVINQYFGSRAPAFAEADSLQLK
jgi:hypothetical protein